MAQLTSKTDGMRPACLRSAGSFNAPGIIAWRPKTEASSWAVNAPAGLRLAPTFVPRAESCCGMRRVAGGLHTPRNLRRLSGPAGMILAFALTLAGGPGPARAQEQHKRKVPGLEKINAGLSRQAFTGKVRSLDLGRHLLEVNTVEGGNTEIFPVKKGVPVSLAEGGKLRLTALTPGTDVIIYYEQKGDRRMVKEIVVLVAGSTPDKKKSPPPS